MSAWRMTSVARPTQYRSPGLTLAAALANSRTCPVPIANPWSRSSVPKPRTRSRSSSLIQELGQELLDAAQVVAVLDHPAEADARGVGVHGVGAQERQRLGPVDGLGGAGHLDEVQLAHAGHRL